MIMVDVTTTIDNNPSSFLPLCLVLGISCKRIEEQIRWLEGQWCLAATLQSQPSSEDFVTSYL